MALHLLFGLICAAVFPCLNQRIRFRIVQRWSAQLLNILGVHIEVAGEALTLRSGIVVTNHISWLDVFVLNALIPMRFVAKSEVRSWPVIGWLCARVQTLFIERGRARDAARVNKQLVGLLKEGGCLALFPEGTSTDGSGVKPFHASLLQPAIDAGASVYPLAIRYQDALGRHSTAPVYADDLSFVASLSAILHCRSLHVRLTSTPALNAGGCDRRTLCSTAHQQISAAVKSMHHTAQLSGEVHASPACAPVPAGIN